MESVVSHFRRRWGRVSVGLLGLAISAFADESLSSATAKLRQYGRPVSRSVLPDRCATSSFQKVALEWDRLTPRERRELAPYFQRPSTPGGGPWPTQFPLDRKLKTVHFVIHYTTRGKDAPPVEDVLPQNGHPDYVDLVADAFERSYRFEVEMMGFKKPIEDSWGPNNEGDPRYDVYLFDAPFLGVTVSEWFDRVLPTALTASFWFGINSRMYEYFGKEEGKRYVETTCAHEFLHACQYAYNARLPAWVAEATSTWIEARVYDGGRTEDGDDYNDPEDSAETDGTDQVYQQIRQWFLKPDTALDTPGGHAYGNVIFINYLTERFGVDIVREIYEAFSDGASREFGNFWDLFATKGTNWVEVFKTFTVWNYFTADRAGLFPSYRFAHRYPPIGIHPQDVHRAYPVSRLYNENAMPEAMSARYVVFEPPPEGFAGTLSVKVRGASVDDLIAANGLLDFTEGKPDRTFYQRWLQIVGLRGWAAPLIIEKADGTVLRDEIFLYHFSQEGQRDIPGFGTDVRRVILILVNARPDTEERGNYISYAAGLQPRGRVSHLVAEAIETGGVRLTWQLDDLTDIRELYVIRKRFSPYDGDTDFSNFRDAREVFHAGDRDENAIPDASVNILARLSATATSYVDTAPFNDVFTGAANFDPSFVRYFYAVVPVNAFGIMGEPAIAADGVTPIPPAAPAFLVSTRELRTGLWSLFVRSTRPLREPPTLRVTLPDGSQVNVSLRALAEDAFEAEWDHPSYPRPGLYRYSLEGTSKEGVSGSGILVGGIYRYAPKTLQPRVQIFPHRVHRMGEGPLEFYPRGIKIRLYTPTGAFLRELDFDNKWDGTNSRGEPVVPGIYFYVAEDGKGFHETGKVVLRW